MCPLFLSLSLSLRSLSFLHPLKGERELGSLNHEAASDTNSLPDPNVAFHSPHQTEDSI